MVTKEIDWRVAKAYVALASNPEFQEDPASTSKESFDKKVPNPKSTPTKLSAGIESRAVDMYLEDEEWEQNELNAGRYPHIPKFSLQSATFASGFGTKGKLWP
jgi:hypothetical protein